MLLALLVAGYVVVAVVSLWAAVESFLHPMTFIPGCRRCVLQLPLLTSRGEAELGKTLILGTLGPRLSFPFRDLARRLRLALLGVAITTSGTGILDAREPQSTPINDPELAALLRPSAPIVEEQLTRSQDGDVYYSARLKHLTEPGFTKRYLAELDDRGVRIVPVENSPHAVRQRVVGYEFMAWQEASLSPYTIRFREGKNREETMVEEPRLRPSYPHPVSVTLDRLVIRVPAAFAKPWRTAVVVPTANRAKLPLPIPLPPDAVVLGVSQERYLELIGGEWRRTSPRQDMIAIQSRMAPGEISGFFKQVLRGSGKVLGEASNNLTWQLGPLPQWAPTNADYVYVDPTGSTLFQQGAVAVADSTHADDFQRKTLPHLPRDVRSYLIIVGFKKEPAK